MPISVYTQDKYEGIIKDFERIVERHDFHGSIMISRDEEVLFQKAYGLANREQKIRNTIDTKYTYASMGKMFTGVAIMQLVEKGQIVLDDKLINIWPDYPNKKVAEQITIHQLLTHTAGINGLFQMASEDHLSDLKDYLPLFVDKDLEFEPGSRMSYSNGGYLLLGLIIEEVTGDSYFEYLDKNIFLPAGMTSTDLILSNASDEFAINYTTWISMGQGEAEIMDYGHDGNSAGGGYATVRDFTQFGAALINGKLLLPESVKKLTKGYVDGRGRGQYGYGFYVNQIEELKMFGHGGGGPGVNGEFQNFEDEKLMISILSNSDPHTSTFLKDAFTGLLLKKAGLMPQSQRDGQVIFELEGYEDAKFVTVQGAFTNGNMFKYPLRRDNDSWITQIDLPPGKHLYRFIVDGTSISDPNNPNSMRARGGLVISEITVE